MMNIVWMVNGQVPIQPLSRIGDCRVNTDKRNLVAILAASQSWLGRSLVNGSRYL